MADKEEIRRLLQEGRYHSLLDVAGSGPQLFRVLISLAFDKEDIICWKAIEAVGAVSGELAKISPDRVRTQVQRLLWMMRDESGNNPSAAPEMLGEIVRNAPETFADIAPIIASFHDEEGLRRGVLYGVLRIAEAMPDLARPSSYLCGEYLTASDAVVRAYAVLLAGELGLTERLPEIEAMRADEREVRLYRNGAFQLVTLGQVARESVKMIRGDE